MKNVRKTACPVFCLYPCNPLKCLNMHIIHDVTCIRVRVTYKLYPFSRLRILWIVHNAAQPAQHITLRRILQRTLPIYPKIDVRIRPHVFCLSSEYTACLRLDLPETLANLSNYTITITYIMWRHARNYILLTEIVSDCVLYVDLCAVFLQSVDTRYLSCPPGFTINHLNKFIALKFGLTKHQQVCITLSQSDSDRVSLCCPISCSF